MAFVAALLSASVRLCLKKTFMKELYGICCFSFFLGRFENFLPFSQKFELSKN